MHLVLHRDYCNWANDRTVKRHFNHFNNFSIVFFPSPSIFSHFLLFKWRKSLNNFFVSFSVRFFFFYFASHFFWFKIKRSCFFFFWFVHFNRLPQWNWIKHLWEATKNISFFGIKFNKNSIMVFNFRAIDFIIDYYFWDGEKVLSLKVLFNFGHFIHCY